MAEFAVPSPLPELAETLENLPVRRLAGLEPPALLARLEPEAEHGLGRVGGVLRIHRSYLTSPESRDNIRKSMRRFASSFVALAPLFLVSACQDQSETEPFATDAGDANRDTGFAPPDPEYECEPNVAALENGIFKRGCAFINCHTHNAFAGSLILVDSDLRDELVGRDAVECRGWKRVVPGSPETSLLWNKLTLDPPACGVRMPWGGLNPLPQHALDCVRNWILGLSSPDDAGGP
jgi:hypothetical protein